jgi:L-alanine-DL-glutamate epimerase-like enolase superfamily enzyme
MQLTKATSYAIAVPPPHHGGFAWYFVRLETDSGLVGWGETAVLTALMGHERAFHDLIESMFNRYLVGRDPMNRDPLNKQMYAGLSYHHNDYLAAGIISAFDIAMWDICGKAFGVPVADLLGGRHRERIRTYTYIYDLGTEHGLLGSIANWVGNPKRLGELARMLVDEGFTGLKLDPLDYLPPGSVPLQPWEIPPAQYDRAERCIEAIRDAIGTEADICIGTHGQTTPSVARRLARRLEKYDPLWLEEPCPPENFEEMGRIAQSTSIPIATGERLAYVHDFQKLFAAGACAFAQPDLGSCGGITAAKQIAGMAEAYYVLMAPHIWGGPVITAAALQLDAATPNFLIQESIHTSHGFFDEIVKEPFRWEDGDLIIDDRPGIGIELDEERLAAYAI